MADTFMGRVKKSVTRELWDGSPLGVATQSIADEDWRRIGIGVIRAGGAIVPRAQVRVMANILRLLEDAYLSANHMRATSGDVATYEFFRAREYAVLDIMRDVRDVIDGSTW